MDLTRRNLLVGVSAAAAQAACSPITETACRTAAAPGCVALAPGAPPPAPIPGVGLLATRCEVYAWNEVQKATPTVYLPSSEAELRTLFQHVPPDRRVTVRGGGQAMDSQSLNTDLVFLMDHECFQWIGEPYRSDDGFRVEVGAGAKWWDIVAKVGRYGLMPQSFVTAPSATIGGTVSADCVSRMSCIVGKEGMQVVKFTIVLPDGSVTECSREDTDPEKAALFNAAIGGFGYLGCLTRITIDLVVARSNPGVICDYPCVETYATVNGPGVNWDSILRALHSKAKHARASYTQSVAHHRGRRVKGVDADPRPPEWTALSMSSFLSGAGLSANLLEQRYVDKQPLRPYPGGVYQADNSFPPGAEALNTWWPSLVDLALNFAPAGDFVDDLFGWGFFLGNSSIPARAEAKKQGNRLNITQQSFALPAGTTLEHVDTRAMQRFMELVEARLHAADIQPIAIDFLYIPSDEFLMSASHGLISFVVTLSFTELNRKDQFSPELVGMLHALTADCRSLGGRVHLVKGVFADAGDLRVMYGEAARAFRKLKKKYDPHGILRNEFFERVFEA